MIPLLLAITFILSPAYVIRFNLFHLPTDALMVWVVFLWLIFAIYLAIKGRYSLFFASVKKIDKKILILLFLFFLSGVIALFIDGLSRDKLGQFIVWFLQPLSVFFIAKFFFDQDSKAKNSLLFTIYCLLALAGAYAIIQYFTLLGLPSIYWGNSVEPKRALSFFVHPNFYALWCAPLLALLIPDLGLSLKSKIVNFKSLAWILGTAGLLLSLSRSGWLGLGVAALVYLIFAADKKVRKIILITGVVLAIIVLSVPNLRWRIILPFYGEKSAVSRISLWHDGFKAVADSPILGLGLTGFAKNYGYLNTDPNLDTHNFPHNIFLNFWTETGLLGLISFLAIAAIFITRGLKSRGDIFKLGAALFLIAILCQGQVDNPYFKNDLALVFWLVLALGL